MPRSRLDIEQLPLTLRPPLHSTIIPDPPTDQVNQHDLFSGLLGRPPTELDSAVAVDQARWRQERRWLNQHRSELA
ncbi:MAG: hypothetical protein LC721_12415, partial [Actinobacteria bacterium]|nr:hypothetical protein [Actinomycetota bacterium]